MIVVCAIYKGEGNSEGGVKLWAKSCNVSVLLSENRLHVTRKGKGKIDIMDMYLVLPYSGNVWRRESLANLASCPRFAKL